MYIEIKQNMQLLPSWVLNSRGHRHVLLFHCSCVKQRRCQSNPDQAIYTLPEKIHISKTLRKITSLVHMKPLIYLHPNHLNPVDSSSCSLAKELRQGLLRNREKTTLKMFKQNHFSLTVRKKVKINK